MSEPWRKAAGVLRGAIPPGETPESMIRRMRDGESDAERALAVLDRLLRDRTTYSVELSVGTDEVFAEVWLRDPQRSGPFGDGSTVAAALLTLGARLAEGDDGDE